MEQMYKFIDKSGHCFEDFQTSTKTSPPKDEIDKLFDTELDDGEKRYRDRVGAMMRGGCEFSVGDMLCFRDDLIDAGFKWGRDFYVIKV